VQAPPGRIAAEIISGEPNTVAWTARRWLADTDAQAGPAAEPHEGRVAGLRDADGGELAASMNFGLA
jgi:hypothetical protein